MKLITAVLFLCFTSPAFATILSIEASGYMADYHQMNAYFASAFPNDLTLEGKPASMSFTVDTSRAGTDPWLDPRGYRALYGGQGQNFVTATSLTIGGLSFASLLPNQDGQADDGAELWDQGLGYWQDDIWVGDSSILTDGTNVVLSLTIHSTLMNFLNGLALDQVTDLTTPSDLFSFGGIEFTQGATHVSEILEFTSARISVPEPGTLVILLSGLTVIALMARSRRMATRLAVERSSPQNVT
jgi:hypothetical protein